MEKRITKAAVHHAKEILRLYAEQNPNDKLQEERDFEIFRAGFIAHQPLSSQWGDFAEKWCKKEYQKWRRVSV